MIKFDAQKAYEIIIYFANRCKITDYYNILKYLYLADKLHLERYGRFISGDIHYAMKFGPVPSKTYDIIKNVKNGLDLNCGFMVSGFKIEPNRDANIDYLSETDIECLDEIINKYGECNFENIHDESLDDAYEEYFVEGTSTLIPLKAIIKTLPNSDELIEYLNVTFG